MNSFQRFRQFAQNGPQQHSGKPESASGWLHRNGGIPKTTVTAHGDPAEAAAPSYGNTPPNPSVAYQFGVQNGRKQIDPENFEEYLRRSAEEESINEQLSSLQLQEQEVLTEITSVREKGENLAHLEVEIPQLEAQVEEFGSEIQEVTRGLEAAREQLAGVRHIGLLSFFLIYGLAAIAFVLADIVITRVIVADALELKGERLFGWDESWYFAIALALLAVLLKPAYDRLVEEPYWEGKRRRFDYTILVTSGFAVLTLITLGAFRTVAYRSDTERQIIESTLMDNPESLFNKLLEIQSQVAEHPLGMFAFIMSGVLFAIAGAICLGIGLRHLQDYWHIRRPIRKRIKGFEERLEQLRAQHNRVRNDHVTKQADLRRTQVWLENRPQLSVLEERIESLRAERTKLLNRKAEVRQEQLSRLYADGYAMGVRLGDQTPQPAGRSVRPFVAIRRAIRTSNFNKL